MEPGATLAPNPTLIQITTQKSKWTFGYIAPTAAVTFESIVPSIISISVATEVKLTLSNVMFWCAATFNVKQWLAIDCGTMKTAVQAETQGITVTPNPDLDSNPKPN